jgi:DNA-binding helix-hairpin-helix protein with protein kinase domain
MGKEKIIIGISSGANYTIEKEIGRGGQGRVYSIVGGKYAFKLIGKKTSSKAQLLKRKISYIKTRPIEDLPISTPIEQVEGEALGYIMEMATDMTPIESLIKPDSEVSFLEWWYETGGIKKRILILKKIAKTLAELHSRGLVYGDFSLSNIFVSEDKEYSEIFFIDSDNITHESKVGTAVYTPGYAAPEIIQTESHQATSGYDTYTDDFSFAIIAYQLLTLNHPFIGDYVNEGEPELEEKAYLGEIPWVNHSSDNKNSTSSGIPTSLTISKKMMSAFQQTFENGIAQKIRRTSSFKWTEILSGALDAIIECQNKSCNQNFFFSKDLRCPFCQEQMNFVGMARIHPLIKKMKDEVKYNFSVKLEDIQNIGEVLNIKIITPNNYLIFYENDFLLNSSNRQLFKIKLKSDSIYIKGLALKLISIISNKKYKKDVDITNEIKVNLTGDFTLFFDDLNKYQRILKLKKYSI